MTKKIADNSMSLADADILSQRRVSRRSLLNVLGVGLGTAAAAVVGRPAVSGAQAPTGCTDTDLGRFEDAVGFGRNCRPRTGSPTGCTDTDGGPNQDPPRYGTRCWI